jgi:hypothetical protein
MAQIHRALSHFPTWLAIWIIGVIGVYVVRLSLVSPSQHLDAFEYVAFGAAITLAIISDSGAAGWLALFFFLLGPPFGAWAIYRAIRWLAGY